MESKFDDYLIERTSGGRPVRLRFVLSDADLYSLRFVTQTL